MEKYKLEAIYVNEVAGNGNFRNETIIRKKKISELVELPLIKACQNLYDKNIKTLESSANSTDVRRGYAYIVVDYNSLSEENKQISDKYFDEHKTTINNIESTLIKIPVNEKTTIKELEEKSLELTNKLKKQPLSWTRVFTLEEATKQIVGDSDISRCPLEEVEKYFYHDKETGLFFLSKEHYEKLKEFKDEYKLKTSNKI